MEIFDVCDKNGNPTGQTVERSMAHSQGIRHRTAHVWIIRKNHVGDDHDGNVHYGISHDKNEHGVRKHDGNDHNRPDSGRPGQTRIEVLLQKRSADKDSFPGCYDTSSAGHVPAGASPKESALRELGEELGIHAKSDDLLFIDTFDISYESFFHGKVFRDEETAFVFLYQKAVDIHKLTLQEEEVEEVKWFELDELLKLSSQKDPSICVPPDGLKLIASYLKKEYISAGDDPFLPRHACVVSRGPISDQD